MHLSRLRWLFCFKKFFVVSTVNNVMSAAAAAAKSLQSCLCDPIDGSPPGSPMPGILQARTLEWIAISFSNASKWKVKVKWFSRVRLFVTPWTAAYLTLAQLFILSPCHLYYVWTNQNFWLGHTCLSPILCDTVLATLHINYLWSLTFLNRQGVPQRQRYSLCSRLYPL